MPTVVSLLFSSILFHSNRCIIQISFPSLFVDLNITSMHVVSLVLLERTSSQSFSTFPYLCYDALLLFFKSNVVYFLCTFVPAFDMLSKNKRMMVTLAAKSNSSFFTTTKCSGYSPSALRSARPRPSQVNQQSISENKK
jgi:hypothetical protein